MNVGRTRSTLGPFIVLLACLLVHVQTTLTRGQEIQKIFLAFRELGCRTLFPVVSKATNERIQELVEFLRRGVVGLAEVVVQATVVAITLAVHTGWNLCGLQHVFQKARLSSRVGISWEVQEQERRYVLAFGHVCHG